MVVCAHEDMNHIAVGFKDGTVIVIRGNITRDRQSRHRTVHLEEGAGVYVTGECVCVCVCVCVCEISHTPQVLGFVRSARLST